MTLGVRTLVYVMDSLAENNCNSELYKLYKESAKSQKAHKFLKPKTRQIIQSWTKDTQLE